MVDETQLTIYDTYFKNSDCKPYKRLRNYSDEDIMYYLETLTNNRKSAIITKSNTDIGKKQSIIAICDKQDI